MTSVSLYTLRSAVTVGWRIGSVCKETLLLRVPPCYLARVIYSSVLKGAAARPAYRKPNRNTIHGRGDQPIFLQSRRISGQAGGRCKERSQGETADQVSGETAEDRVDCCRSVDTPRLRQCRDSAFSLQLARSNSHRVVRWNDRIFVTNWVWKLCITFIKLASVAVYLQTTSVGENSRNECRKQNAECDKWFCLFIFSSNRWQCWIPWL